MPSQAPGGLPAIQAALSPHAPLIQGGIHTEEDTGKTYYSGYAYKTLYDWDQYFEAILQFYLGMDATYIKNGVTIFLDHQRESGLISRSVPSSEFHDPEHVKPFLAQTAVFVWRAYGEVDWVFERGYFEKLRRYIAYWREAMDSTGDGLGEWMSAPHTGMDNHHMRAGHWGDRISKGVDLNCWLARELEAMALLARHAGHTEASDAYLADAQRLADIIGAQLWDETEGFFFDRHVRTGESIRVKTVAGFMPLWAGIATPEQASRLVYDHLLNGAEFWSPFPIPALARCEGGYSAVGLEDDVLGANTCSWRANTWIPTNYMVFHGLLRYGFDQVARALAESTARLMAKAGNREFYDAETGAGMGLDPFWGWSLLGHVMLHELDQGNPLLHIAAP